MRSSESVGAQTKQLSMRSGLGNMNSAMLKNTIRGGGSTALYSAYTVDTVYTVYTVDRVHTV